MSTIQPWLAAVLVIGGYLLGSIPFGVIATRMAGLDIRTVGSGNIGATNVLRTGRKDLAAITLIGDGGKGAGAVGLAALLAHQMGLVASQPLMCALAGGAAFLGHLFPVWLKFKGGKGVATFLGVLLAASFVVGLLACATWVAVAKILKISSLSALVATALAPVYAYFLGCPAPTVILAAVLAVLVLIRHHENIRRLLAGTEPRIGANKPPKVVPRTKTAK